MGTQGDRIRRYVDSGEKDADLLFCLPLVVKTTSHLYICLRLCVCLCVCVVLY